MLPAPTPGDLLFRVSGFTAASPWLRFRVSGCWRKISCFMLRVWGFGLHVPRFGFRVSG